MKKRFVSFLLAWVLLLSLPTSISGIEANTADIIADTAEYLIRTNPSPQVGSVGGEWLIFGLSRGDCALPKNYCQKYYTEVEAYVKSRAGKLDGRKYTEYSRIVLAVSSMGKDARNVAGYDLTRALGDYEGVTRQGINGAIWALIALDCRNYPMPQVPDSSQATRQMYIEYILSRQLPNGGWSFSGNAADEGLTAMALQALAKYQSQSEVSASSQKAMRCLSAGNSDATCESCAQNIVALCELGLPVDEQQINALLSYYQRGKGFSHREGEDTDPIATEQALYALAALHRAQQGKNSLYRISTQRTGHPDVNVPAKGKNVFFSDVMDNKIAIEALSSRGILSGKGNGKFEPNASMTRGEFAVVITNALGLPHKNTNKFTDVSGSQWYGSGVGSASAYGIVCGTGNGAYQPNRTITRQEAAVMISRAAALCGLETEISEKAAITALKNLPDNSEIAPWATNSIAFCVRNGIVNDAERFYPNTAVTRGEVADMVYRMLQSAGFISP